MAPLMVFLVVLLPLLLLRVLLEGGGVVVVREGRGWEGKVYRGVFTCSEAPFLEERVHTHSLAILSHFKISTPGRFCFSTSPISNDSTARRNDSTEKEEEEPVPRGSEEGDNVVVVVVRGLVRVTGFTGGGPPASALGSDARPFASSSISVCACRSSEPRKRPSTLAV